jgi:hypothetical protein
MDFFFRIQVQELAFTRSAHYIILHDDIFNGNLQSKFLFNFSSFRQLVDGFQVLFQDSSFVTILLHSLLLSTSSFSLQPHFILPWTPFLFLLTHTRLLMRSMLIHALTHALTHAYLCLFMHLLIRLLMHTFAYSCAYSYTSLLTHTQ